MKCPTGADCSVKDGQTLTELTAKPGYWRPDPTSHIFSPCVVGYTSLNAQESVHWTLPEVVKFVEGSDPEKEIGHTCEFDDMFYSRDIDNGRNGGKDSIVDGLLNNVYTFVQHTNIFTNTATTKNCVDFYIEVFT